MFYGGLSTFYVCVGAGGALFHISAKRICVRRESLMMRLRTKVRRTFENVNVPPRGFFQVFIWWNT